MSRKLARVVTIDSLHAIEGADRIELAMVGGKGLYQPGDLAVYFEIDSLLPTDNPAFSELADRLSSKLLFEIDGKGYARIKTAKLMKQLSQGFCVPLQEINEQLIVGVDLKVDDDLTDKLGILKYEAGEERSMNNAGVSDGIKGKASKPFPSFIPKTDQNRVQNVVPRFLLASQAGEKFEKTFKLDGSSMTVWFKDGHIGVASRNVSFNLQTVNKGFVQTFKEFVARVKKKGWKKARWIDQIEADNNAFTQMASNSGAVTALVRAGRNLAIQGEMVGPSIQKNFEGVDSNQFYIYDIYDIDAQAYLLPTERVAFLIEHELRGVPEAGIVDLPETVAEVIEDADGPSGLKGKYREGFVYKSMTRDFSFKVISNKYLLKEV